MQDLMRFARARKIARASFELAKQLDKVNSSIKYTEKTKRIPDANLGFFIMYEFNYAESGFGNPQISLPDNHTFASAHNDISAILASSPNLWLDGNTDQSTENQDNKGASSILKKMGLQYGLELIGKGTKYDDDGFSSKVTLLYMQIPIHALYFYQLPKGKLYGGLGPYLAYGLAGKSKTDQDSFKAFDKDNGLRRFDAGASFTAGYLISERIMVSLEYDLGLANLARDHEFKKIRNRTIGLNVGYVLSPGQK